MVKTRKHGKLNMTLPMEFLQLLRSRAEEEHLPTATFTRKFLMDHMEKNNGIEKCILTDEH
jgi:hypothetical protein